MNNWSPEEDKKLTRLWLRDRATSQEIAYELEKSSSAVHRRIDALGLKGRKGDVALYADLTGEKQNPVISPVRYDLDVPKTDLGDSVDEVTLHWGDLQYPFHDPRAEEVLYSIARDAKPTGLYCMGDIPDFYEISDYRPKSDRCLPPDGLNLQESIKQATKHLAIMRSITPATEAHYLFGNHEDRWERMLHRAADTHKARHILRLPKMKEAMRLEYHLGTEDLGYKTYPYYDAPIVTIHDKLIVLHGERANIHVSKAMLERYGMSVMFGHTHRIQTFSKRNVKLGNQTGYSIGCLCDINPDWRPFPNWQQGFAVVTWKKTTEGWFFNVEQIRIENGQAAWRGKVYGTNSA